MRSEARREKMARKQARRDTYYKNLTDPKRVEDRLRNGFLTPRDDGQVRHKYIPHQGEREIARRAARV